MLELFIKCLVVHRYQCIEASEKWNWWGLYLSECFPLWLTDTQYKIGKKKESSLVVYNHRGHSSHQTWLDSGANTMLSQLSRFISRWSQLLFSHMKWVKRRGKEEFRYLKKVVRERKRKTISCSLKPLRVKTYEIQNPKNKTKQSLFFIAALLLLLITEQNLFLSWTVICDFPPTPHWITPPPLPCVNVFEMCPSERQHSLDPEIL